MRLPLIFVGVSWVAGARVDPIVTLPLRVENAALVTDGISINGQSFAMMIDVNSADAIVPICNSSRAASECFDPTKSGAFRYCSGDSFCFDRQEPQFACNRTVPVSEWSLESSVFSQHKILIDGVSSDISAFEFVDSAYVGENWKGVVPLKGAVDLRRPVLGIGPKRMSCRNKTLASELGATYMEISAESLSFFALPNPGITFSQPFQMVPTNASVMLGKYAFNMHRPSVCGVDILGNVSSHWSVIVDPTTECLVLPEFMLSNLRTWKMGSDNFLSFSLSDDSSVTGDAVALDLSNVCLQSRPVAESDSDFGYTGIRPVVLGYRALQAIGKVGFEISSPFRVGFSLTTPPAHSCTTPVPACIGDQTYHAASNSCIDPPCGDFLFSELNMATRICDWKPFTAYLVYGTVLLIVVGELALHRLRRKTLQLAQSSCERDIEPSS